MDTFGLDSRHYEIIVASMVFAVIVWLRSYLTFEQ
jgi:hypothetical protein